MRRSSTIKQLFIGACTIVPSVGSLETIVDMNGLTKGFYLLRFDNGYGQPQTLRFLKE